MCSLSAQSAGGSEPEAGASSGHRPSPYKWACEAAQESGETLNEIRWTHDRADILHQRGEYREAESLYTFCEEKARSLDNNVLALTSRNKRALCVRAQGRIGEAEQLCQTTIDEARQ
jgi:ATP/maltotriose-dependent transcriptional regulator MalT